MKTLRIYASVALAVALCAFSLETAFAGTYSFGRGAGASYHPPASPVYGFQPGGQSFVYQQAGKAMYHTGAGSAGSEPGRPGYSPYYRFDTFAAPRAGRSSRPPVFAPPSYFGGKLWYPRGY